MATRTKTKATRPKAAVIRGGLEATADGALLKDFRHAELITAVRMAAPSRLLATCMHSAADITRFALSHYLMRTEADGEVVPGNLRRAATT